MSSVVHIAYQYKFQIAVAAVSASVIAFQWHIASYILDQLRILLAGILVSPITPHQNVDINFWGGQFIGSAVVVMITWAVLKKVPWQESIADAVFGSAWQKVLFKHFAMPTIESAVFFFAMRQIVVFTSWLFVPPAVRAADTSSWDMWQRLRYVVDGKVVAPLVYILASLFQYGFAVKLFQPPLDPLGAAVVKTLMRTAVYVSVAAVRIYPLLNGHKVSIISFLWLLISRYPFLALALGAASIEPSDFVARIIRERKGVNFLTVSTINVVNVASMLWSNAAGMRMAELLLETHPDLPDRQFDLLVDTGTHLILLGVLYMFARTYASALSVLFWSSPLLQCEATGVEVVGVRFLEGGSLLDKIWELKQRLPSLSTLTRAMSGDQLPADANTSNGEDARLSETFQSLLHIVLSIHQMTQGRPIAVELQVSARLHNPTQRTLHMPPGTIEVLVSAGGRLGQLLLVDIDEFSVPPSNLDLIGGARFDQQITQSIKAYVYVDHLCSILQQTITLPWWGSGDGSKQRRGVETFLATMYTDSSFSTLSLPLLTFSNGHWRGIGLLDPVRGRQPGRASQQSRDQFQRMAEELARRRAEAMGTELNMLPPAVRLHMEQLMNILQRVYQRGGAGSVGTAQGLQNSLRAYGSSIQQEDGDIPEALDVTADVRGEDPSSQTWRRSVRRNVRMGVATAAPGTQQSHSALLEALQGIFPFLDCCNAPRRRHRLDLSDATSSQMWRILKEEVPELIKALYLVIDMQKKLKQENLPSSALYPALYETGAAILHLAYDTAFTSAVGKHDPLYLVLLCLALLTLQALLFSENVAHLDTMFLGLAEHQRHSGVITSSQPRERVRVRERVTANPFVVPAPYATTGPTTYPETYPQMAVAQAQTIVTPVDYRGEVQMDRVLSAQPSDPREPVPSLLLRPDDDDPNM